MRSKLFTIIGLILFGVIIILPPIIYGYVYPNVGDDSAGHLAFFDSIKAGNPSGLRYLAYAFVGYPLVWISNLTSTSIDTLYLWFTYGVLILVGITIYFVVSRLVNREAGWFALWLTTFCAQGILFLFYFGQIFNLINIGIILPLLLYFIVKYLIGKRVYQLVLVLIFAGLFGSFHTSGIYLPIVASFATLMYVIYARDKKYKINIHGIVLGIGIVVLSAIAFVLIPEGRYLVDRMVFSIINRTLTVPLVDYLLGIVSPTLLVLLVGGAVYSKNILKNINKETKILITILSCTIMVLAVAAFAPISPDPWRQALDLATILALFVAVLLGLFIRQQKDKLLIIIILIVVGVGLFHNVPAWFSYNSAIRLADKQAIEFVNNLDCQTYSCSAEVAPWIYNRFLKAEYIKDEGEVLIMRSTPMTPKSDKSNMWFDKHGIEMNDNYVSVIGFCDDVVWVNILLRADLCE
ncbi:MAG: hypothetical protein V3U84_12310 [Thiotrichaceae bacterium]